MGRDTEQEKRLGDRTKWFQEAVSDRETDSPWDKVQLKKGAVACAMPQISETMMETDIEKKWEDFEKIPVGDMRSLTLIGSDAPQGTNEELQTEVQHLGRSHGFVSSPADILFISTFSFHFILFIHTDIALSKTTHVETFLVELVIIHIGYSCLSV